MSSMKKTFDEVVLFARTGLNPRQNFKLGQGHNAYITIKNIKNNSLIIDENTDVVDDEAIKLIHKRSQIKKGDILFASIGRMGDMYIIDEEPTDWDINESVFAFTLDTSIVRQKYFYYIFRVKSTLDYLTSNSSGSTFKSIKMNQLKKMVFDIPSLEEQDRIVKLLDNVCNVIEMRKQELSVLDNLIKARFVELFGNPVLNEKGWDTAELNEVCDGIGDGLHGTPEYDDKGEFPFINGNNLIDGVIKITPATKFVNEEIYNKHYIEISDNAILLSINGTLGKLAFYSGEQVMLGKSACYCNLKPEINKEFVYGVMKTEAFAEFLESNATASTIKNVGLKAIRGFRLILPPDKLQNQFVEFAKQVDKSKFTDIKTINIKELYIVVRRNARWQILSF